MLAFIGEVAFATVCVDGPALVHVPVVVSRAERLLFHVARANPAAARLEGARAIASVLGPDGYVSPDWYGTADQVPTWNYVVVEAEGPLRRLDEEELAHSIDALSAAHEARLAPKREWTRGKMAPGRFEGMLKAIVGYELRIEALRGTRKLGQTKGEVERRRVAEGLQGFGQIELAALILQSSSAFAGEGVRTSDCPRQSEIGSGGPDLVRTQAKPGGGAAPQARSSGRQETGAARRPLHHSLRERSPSPRKLGED